MTAVARPLAVPERFRASCSAGDVVGDLVHVAGAISGGVLPVARADITTDTKMPAVGIIVAKPSSTTAVVQRLGGVDLTGQLSGLLFGKVCWVGPDGRPSTAPPALLVPFLLQTVGVATGPGSLELSPSFDMLEAVP